jgi:hypothetical protein
MYYCDILQRCLMNILDFEILYDTLNTELNDFQITPSQKDSTSRRYACCTFIFTLHSRVTKFITISFIDCNFDNTLSLVMFLDFLVTIEFVPRTLKNSFYLLECPINLKIVHRAKM